MPERINPQTSLDAYHSLKPEQVRDIYVRIKHALSLLKLANTEAIAEQLKMPHPQIHKRVSEMERLEMIYKPGSKSVMKSGRMGFNWALRGIELPPVVEQPTNYKKSTTTAGTIASNIINNTKQQSLF